MSAASAWAAVQYLDDGAVPNGTTGGWDLPAQGTCPGAAAQGYTGINTRPKCTALRLNLSGGACASPNFSSTTSGVCNDLVNTTKASCEAAGDRIWNPATPTYPSGVCAVVMSDDDRNDVVCALHGGTWDTTTNCIGVWVMPARTAYTPNLLTSNSPGDQCLRCHNTVTQYNGARVRDVQDVLFMGHKNMARKVKPGNKWGGPPMQCDLSPLINTLEDVCLEAGGHWYPIDPYPTDDAGNVFDWAAGTISIGGTPHDLLWIYADWLSPLPKAIAKLPASTSQVCSDPRYTTATCVANGGTLVLNAGASYSCARCHTTGWTSDAAINTAAGIDGKEPELSFPGVTWDRNSDAPANVVNLSGGVSGDPNKYASWDNYGIVCSRCHGSAIETTSGTGSPAQYSSPSGMSSHHSNLTAVDAGGGVCSDSRWTSETACTNAGGSWITGCSINPTAGVCTYAANTSAKCAAGAVNGTWVSVPAWCSNAFYTTQASCTTNGFTWQDGWCTNGLAQGACTGGSGDAAKTWRLNGTQASCQLNNPVGTWSFSKCSVEAVCNKGTCSNPSYPNAINCKANGGTWTPITTLAACTAASGQFRYATDNVRCEDADGVWSGSNKNRGPIITSLCMQCHRQETSGLPYADSGGGVGSDSTSHPGTYVKVAQYHDTITFPSHPHGNMFLNSPHGKFSGLFNQIGTAKFGTGYSSFFQFEGEAGNTGNGCTGCHNPHRSTVDGTGGEEAVKPCQECHEKNLGTILHPNGTGTPLEKIATEPSEPCIVCHMPGGDHMFRINPDSAYSTFPTSVFSSSTAANANSAPDGAFTNAVWVDVDAACGQCHGGGAAHATTTGSITKGSATLTVADATGFATGTRIKVSGAYAYGGQPEDWETFVSSVAGTTVTLVGKAGTTVSNAAVEVNPTKNGAPFITKVDLAKRAEGIHNDQPSASFGYKIGSPNTLTVNVDASASTCSGSAASCDAYDWDWGDGTPNGSGVTASHTYATPGNKVIELTVAQYGVGDGSTQRIVTLTNPDLPPTVSGNCSFDANTWTETVTDTSTDDNGLKQVTVNWGDGTLLSNDTTAPFGPFTHTFLIPGSFTLTHKAVDTIGQQKTRTCTATPAYFSISGTVKDKPGTANLASASVTVKKASNGAVVKTVYTAANGTFSAGSLKPGAYTLTVSKVGYTFASPAASITVGPSSAGNTINATAP